jgi:hypothetical protein
MQLSPLRTRLTACEPELILTDPDHCFDGRMVKLLQPVLTAEMMTKPAIALLALPLAMGGLILPTGGGY